MKNPIIIILLIFSVIPPVFGDDLDSDSLRLRQIERKLDAAAQRDPAFLKEVDMSIAKISLPEMLRNIAKVSDVNLTVKGAENIMVSCNFSKARITDLIFFLCREYDLDIDIVGNIVSIFPVRMPPPKPKELMVAYDSLTKHVGFDLENDKLIDVTKKLTGLTKNNIIVPQELFSRPVSGFVEDMPFDGAIEALVAVNGLEGEKDVAGLWHISESPDTGNPGSGFSRRSKFRADELLIDSLGRITARIANGNVDQIITELCERQHYNYFFTSAINHNTGVFVRDVDFKTLLDVLFAGTGASYYKENDIYIFSGGGGDKLVSFQIVPLVCRSVDKVGELVPEGLRKGVNIQAFPDQNSMIVSGDQKDVSRVVNFIKSIDKSVPMVTIEIIIADVTKTNILETGIEMGIGNSPTKTSGKISPGISMDFNSQSVNSLINSFNGFGAVNLGKVTPEFYMSLKLLEDNGNIELRSTPKLSTLNGHEATLKSGETRYYKEITNNYIGYQNPTLTENYIWKSIDANLDIKITPFVSLDNFITLDIEIEQTEFTANDYADPESPPWTATRSFKSLIKVQNEEMVLLGGIDRNSTNKSTSGLPLIARIPILKWFFGKNKNNKIDQKLNVFIKPTVIE